MSLDSISREKLVCVCKDLEMRVFGEIDLFDRNEGFIKFKFDLIYDGQPFKVFDGNDEKMVL